jgi:hypothetical protein
LAIFKKNRKKNRGFFLKKKGKKEKTKGRKQEKRIKT